MKVFFLSCPSANFLMMRESMTAREPGQSNLTFWGTPRCREHGGLFALLTLFLSGCGGTITPPAQVRQPVNVYVTDYGRHSTLLLPTENGGLVEFAFGEWGWLAGYQRHWY